MCLGFVAIPLEMLETSEKPRERVGSRREVAAPIYWKMFSGTGC